MGSHDSSRFAHDFELETVTAGQALSSEKQNHLVDQFKKEGWVKISKAVDKASVVALVSAIERKNQDLLVQGDDSNDYVRGVGLMRMFEYSRAYLQLSVIEPIISLVEAILGPQCHLISQNALRTPKGAGIVNWHIDDELLFPFLTEINCKETRLYPPCFGLSVFVALTNTMNFDSGPTQILPRSHLCGRAPNTSDNTLGVLDNESEVVTLYSEPGDAYFINHQLWHRGAQNISEEIRMVAVTAYGKRFIQQRFYPFINYTMPQHVLTNADEHLLRVLGKHPKGAFG